jgi:hypothetical protein
LILYFLYLKKEVAASNYRQWYCAGKRSKHQMENNKSPTENKSTVDEPSTTDDIETSAATEAVPVKGRFYLILSIRNKTIHCCLFRNSFI